MINVYTSKFWMIHHILIIIHVDDRLSKAFDMKDSGDVSKILGMKININRKLWLSQKNYVEKFLERLRMNKAKLFYTQLANHFKPSSCQSPKTNEEVHYLSKVP